MKFSKIRPAILAIITFLGVALLSMIWLEETEHVAEIIIAIGALATGIFKIEETS